MGGDPNEFLRRIFPPCGRRGHLGLFLWTLGRPRVTPKGEDAGQRSGDSARSCQRRGLRRNPGLPRGVLSGDHHLECYHRATMSHLKSTSALLCGAAIVALGLRTASAEPRRIELEVKTPRLVCAPAGGPCTLTAVASKAVTSVDRTTATVLCDVRAGGERFSSSGVAAVEPDAVTARVAVEIDQPRVIQSVRCSAYLQ